MAGLLLLLLLWTWSEGDVVSLARGDSKRAMMFITDRMSNIGGPPEKIADFLRKQEGFEIFAIGKNSNENNNNKNNK